MSARASRRQVLALIALQADLPTPKEIAFDEGERAVSGHRIDIYLDSVADLHTWLPTFDMTAKHVMAHPYTHTGGPDKGKTSTLANAFSRDDWRGWAVHLNAFDPVGEPEPTLDDATREQLQAVAGGSATGNGGGQS